MLYKKYHRNFVRQFRKGVKFKLKEDSKYIRTAITEPTIELTFATKRPFITVGIAENTVVSLVHYNGRLMEKSCYAIQEIS